MSARKILLVDDSGTLLLLERAALQSAAGYQILAAKDGEAGVRAALAHRPDLILLDAGPPGPSEMAASEICHQLRSHETTRAIPILLLAPRGTEAAQKKARGGFPFGCDGSIIKPFEHNELLSKVRSLLGD